MGKKSAHTGMSPKDISINAMDKFISRNDRKRDSDFQRLGRYCHEDQPVDIWPLQDQINFYDTNKQRIVFELDYPSYSVWRDQVMDTTGVYPSTFLTFIMPHRELMKTMYATQIPVREAAGQLRNLGVY